MASLEQLLRQTMPLAGADAAYTELAAPTNYKVWGGNPPPPGDMPLLFGGQPIAIGEAVKVTRLELGESHDVVKPEITPEDYETPHDVPIWRWSHDASTPSIISNVFCRVRSSDYKSYKVADSIEWGLELEDAKDTLKNCIRITNLVGKRIELPLSKEFVAYKAVVQGGKILAHQTDLWKLPSNHDQSLVLAFVYSLKADSPPLAMTVDDANDLGDGFMPSGGAAAPVAADVHGEASADVDDPRVLVVLSLTTCKQLEDFAPGGIVGMGRIYPHIMVMSTMALSRIEATVRVNRPEAKTIEEGDTVAPPDDIANDKLVNFFRGPKGCCGTYDQPPEDPKPPPEPINSVFFADANDFGIATLDYPAPLPFWSNFFSYYLLDAHQTCNNRTFAMVDHDVNHCRTREIDAMVVRQPVTGPSDYTKILKLPYQGEFDNLHMAPKMRLYKVTQVLHRERDSGPSFGEGLASPTIAHELDNDSLHTDDITMAPFCSHDCFHTHWRWGKDATDASQWGFDGMVPYAKPGKPLIPDNQTLQLWLRAPNLMTYTATVWAFPDKPISANQWQVIMHHGSAYALDITGFVTAFLAKFSVDLFGGPPQFYGVTEDKDQIEITSLMSFSAGVINPAIVYP